jgi:hypothetical protein
MDPYYKITCFFTNIYIMIYIMFCTLLCRYTHAQFGVIFCSNQILLEHISVTIQQIKICIHAFNHALCIILSNNLLYQYIQFYTSDSTTNYSLPHLCQLSSFNLWFSYAILFCSNVAIIWRYSHKILNCNYHGSVLQNVLLIV